VWRLTGDMDVEGLSLPYQNDHHPGMTRRQDLPHRLPEAFVGCSPIIIHLKGDKSAGII
jgi:hypothetical protein